MTALLIPALALTGCAQGLPGLRPLTYASPGEARIFLSTEPCVHDEPGKEFIGLIAAVATAAVSTLLDNFGTALKNGSEGGALPTVTATRNMTLEPGRVPRCLTLVRGSFDMSSGASPVDWTGLIGLETGADGEMRKRFASLHIPPMSRVDQYIELRLAEGPGRKALTYFPAFVLINQSIDGAKKGKRDITINLKFSRPGAPDTGGPVLLANREIGRSYTLRIDPASGRADYEAPWFAFPNGLTPPNPKAADAAAGKPAPAPTPAPTPVATPAPGAGQIVGGAGLGGGAHANAPAQSQLVDPYSRSETAVPVNATITVVETRQTNQGLAFVAAVFTAVKPQINSAVAPILNSDVAATQDQTSFAAQGDYAAAFGTAKTAVLAYCESLSTETTAAGRTDRITKSAAARSAQLKANAAAIKAALPPPFTSIVDISDAVPAAGGAACTAGP